MPQDWHGMHVLALTAVPLGVSSNIDENKGRAVTEFHWSGKLKQFRERFELPHEFSVIWSGTVFRSSKYSQGQGNLFPIQILDFYSNRAH